MLDLSFEAVMSLLSDMCDETKSTAEYQSVLYGRFIFLNTSDEDHKATMGKIAANDNSKRPFGALTGQLQIYGFLGLQHSGIMAQASVNGGFNRGHIALINGNN